VSEFLNVLSRNTTNNTAQKGRYYTALPREPRVAKSIESKTMSSTAGSVLSVRRLLLPRLDTRQAL